MSYQDKSIQCVDCGTTFTFTAGEQEQFAARGYTNEPKRAALLAAPPKSRAWEAAVTAAVVLETEATGQPRGRCIP